MKITPNGLALYFAGLAERAEHIPGFTEKRDTLGCVTEKIDANFTLSVDGNILTMIFDASGGAVLIKVDSATGEYEERITLSTKCGKIFPV